jgi:hypothetical protein
MLREKKTYTVVTFPNTTAALAMEAACKENGMPGRIIPMPSVLSAGCGLSWRAAEEEHDLICAFLEEKGLIYQTVHVVEL